MRYRYFFVGINAFWSLTALMYDWPAIMSLPAWSIPFLVICPIYPALLALAWGLRKPPAAVLAFAALPSALYGVLALFFYPTYLVNNGWDWLAFGQIFWVLAYALQGWYFLLYRKTAAFSMWLAAAFLAAALLVQYYTLSFGYLNFDTLTPPMRTGLLVLGLLLTALLPLANGLRASAAQWKQ